MLRFRERRLAADLAAAEYAVDPSDPPQWSMLVPRLRTASAVTCSLCGWTSPPVRSGTDVVVRHRCPETPDGAPMWEHR